jgi:hypothetical protein
MDQKVLIEITDKKFIAKLYENAAAKAFASALPKEFHASRWGDEYYGDCGLSLQEDKSAREIMEIGELAYWAPGKAFCVFFGPTPASTDSRPRAASAVIPLGCIEGDSSALKKLGPSVNVKISLL